MEDYNYIEPEDFDDIPPRVEDKPYSQPIILTEEQERAVEQVLEWFKSGSEPTLTLGGYAGTGKTTVLNFIREELGPVPVLLTSFTGKATSVMRRKFEDWISEQRELVGNLDQHAPEGDAQAHKFRDIASNTYIQTMHSYMYRAVIDKKTGQILNWIQKEMGYEPYEAQPVSLIINDEASMTTKDLFTDLSSYDKPILAVGDHGQLPPVKSDFNLMQEPVIKLETIHRQAADNPILTLAHQARQGEGLKFGMLTDKVGKVNRRTHVSGVDELLENPGPDTVALVSTNKERVNLNKMILDAINQPTEPCEGHRVICLKNNWKEGIYNGMIGTVEWIGDAVSSPRKHNFRMRFKSDEGTTHTLDVSRYSFLNPHNKPPEGVSWRDLSNQFDFAYAITAHKSQGSEWENVVVFEPGGNWMKEKDRWMYTAITRAKDKLFVVG